MDDAPVTNLDEQLSKREELTPELRRWLLAEVDEEVATAGLRELRAGGGLELEQFLPDLEQAANE